MVRARLTCGVAVASGCLLGLVAVGSTAVTLPRTIMPPAMRTVRSIVAGQQGSKAGKGPAGAGGAAATDGADGAREFDPAKLIKLGDIDDNGAADYAYVTKGAGGGGISLHLFLFDTAGQVISDKSVPLAGAGAEPDALLASVSNKLTSLDTMPLSVRPSMPTPTVRASTPDCLFTPTECECDLKSSILGSGTCLSHVDSTADRSLCVERDCAPSYVCMCGGSQKCSRSTATSPVWVATNSTGLATGETYCELRRVAQALTEVVGPMPTPVPTPPPAGCILTADRCTCGLKSTVAGGVDKCAAHTGLDASGRDMCAERDCADGYVCDCAGGSTCSFVSVTKEFWKLGEAAPSGRNYCERASKTAVVSQCVENC